MALKNTTDVIERIERNCEFATESNIESYIDSQTNEAVIELTVEYDTVDLDAIEIEHELRLLAANLDLDLEINHIGFTKFTAQFRTDEWELRE